MARGMAYASKRREEVSFYDVNGQRYQVLEPLEIIGMQRGGPLGGGTVGRIFNGALSYGRRDTSMRDATPFRLSQSLFFFQTPPMRYDPSIDETEYPVFCTTSSLPYLFYERRALMYLPVTCRIGVTMSYHIYRASNTNL
jgi:hypothetical protein